MGIPVVVLLAVNATVLGEAGELGLEGQLTFTAFQAPQVPLLVHGQQVVPVGDLAPAAGAQGGLLGAQRRHPLQGSARGVRRARGAAPRGYPSRRQPSASASAARSGAPAQRQTSEEHLQFFPLRLAPFLPRPPERGVRVLPGLNLKTRAGHLEPFSKGLGAHGL